MSNVFDQLCKTESHKVVTPKVYHNGFTKWFHIDNFTILTGRKPTTSVVG